MTEQSSANTQANNTQIALQRIYVKDLSFEAPNTPEMFKQNWSPEMNIELNSNAQALEDPALYEVVLSLTVTVKNQEKLAFLIEIKQAGIFMIKDANEEQMDHLLKSFCLQILYPYAREAVTDLASRGSFPQLLLAPIYFDGLYMQQKAEQQEKR